MKSAVYKTYIIVPNDEIIDSLSHYRNRVYFYPSYSFLDQFIIDITRRFSGFMENLFLNYDKCPISCVYFNNTEIIKIEQIPLDQIKKLLMLL